MPATKGLRSVDIAARLVLIITSLLLIVLRAPAQGQGRRAVRPVRRRRLLVASAARRSSSATSTASPSAIGDRLDRLDRRARAVLKTDQRPPAVSTSHAARPRSRRPTGADTWQVATRSGAAGSARARWARPSAASPLRVAASPSGARNGHETRPQLRRPTRQSPTSGTARAAASRPAQDQENPPAPPRNEPYKTHLAYVRERRSDKDGAAILDEALAKLRGDD